MKGALWFVAGLTAIAVLIGVTRVNWSSLDRSANRKGNGQALDYVSKEPIADAEVILDCRRRLLHGSESIRSVGTITTRDGSYHFDSSDTRDCDYVVLSLNRPGYKDIAGLGLPNLVVMPFGSEVPRYAWMIPEYAETRLRLEGLLSSSNAVRTYPVGPMPVEDYLSVFYPFAKSKKVASTPDDIAWVRLHYCSRLRALYNKIPETEREKLLNSAYGADYEIHVRDYCRALPLPSTGSPDPSAH